MPMAAAGKTRGGAPSLTLQPSSCRLSRTTIALGEAAGVASTLALDGGLAYPKVAVADVRQRLGIPAFIEKTIIQWGLPRNSELSRRG